MFCRIPSLSVLHRFILRNGWVAFFFILVGGGYAQVLYHGKSQLTRLSKERELLIEERGRAFKERERLKARVHSYQDIRWQEMVLKEKLGVVSEGETKVVFEE